MLCLEFTDNNRMRAVCVVDNYPIFDGFIANHLEAFVFSL